MEFRCLVCHELEFRGDEEKGIVCANGHYVCEDEGCIREHVRRELQTDPGAAPRRADFQVRCVDRNCEHYLPFVDIFTRWPDLLKDLEDALIRMAPDDEAAGGGDEAAGGDADLRFVQHIQEDVLTLKCPRCRSAFDGFEGCLALQCHHPRCHSYFCGLCFKPCDSNEDAHRHVRICPERPREMNNAYFLPPLIWQRHIDKRNARLTAVRITAVINNLQNAEPGGAFAMRLREHLEEAVRARGPHPPLLVPLAPLRPPLRSGEIVHVKLAGTNRYLSPLWFDCTTRCSKTYGAVVGDEGDGRCRFRFLSGNFDGKGFLTLQLEQRRHNYLESHDCLYNDGWDNVKFDKLGSCLTQKFVLDNDFHTEVVPGDRVRFMDRCRFRYMVANMRAGSRGYAGGSESRKFLESRTPPYAEGIMDAWIVERAA